MVQNVLKLTNVWTYQAWWHLCDMGFVFNDQQCRDPSCGDEYLFAGIQHYWLRYAEMHPSICLSEEGGDFRL